MSASHTIGVDVGGTKVAAGVVDADGAIIASLREPTPASDTTRTAEVIADVIKRLSASHEVEAVGIGAAGFVDAARATVLFAPNLAWRNEPLKQKVESMTGITTVVENDANAAAWGEAKFGAARGASSVVVVTVGTGIGGGIILDGKLLRGRSGVAAEIGHMNIEPRGRRCGCGQRGCWERYSSGTALVNEAQEIAKVAPATAARLLELGGAGPESITGYHVTQAAKEDDPAAIECFNDIGTWLGYGMADLAAVLDPDVFVIAGGVSEAGELLRRPAVASFEKLLTARAFRPMPQVRLATLGNDAGIIGAADLARER